jgi:hypothetical protein
MTRQWSQEKVETVYKIQSHIPEYCTEKEEEPGKSTKGRYFPAERLLARNHVLTVRTGTDPLDRDTTNFTLNVLNVGLGVRGQVLVAVNTHSVALPAWQSNILNLELLNDIGIRRERTSGTSAIGQNVRHTDLDLIKVIEDIELGQVQSGVVVDSVGVTSKHEIEPAAATTTAGGYAEFAANLLELVAVFVELFAGEGAGTDTGGVGFQDTDDGFDACGVEGEGLDGAAETC